MEGFEHVLSVAGAESSTKILIDISDKISKEINEYISVDVEPDVLPMDDVLKMEEIFEKSGTHSVPLIENVNRKVTEMFVDDTVSEMAHRQEWTSNKTQKIRCLPDKLQELSRNINDSSTNTEINKLHQKAEGVCNSVTKAFTVTGSDVLKEKEKLSRVSCPSRVDIERLSQTLLAFIGDLRTCTNEIFSIKSSINNCVGINRCAMKLIENEIIAAETEVYELDKQIQLTQKEISKYEDEAYNEERGAVDLEDRAKGLRHKLEEHKEKGLLWGYGSLSVGKLFAPLTLSMLVTIFSRAAPLAILAMSQAGHRL
ncbi:uncharacterized protein LOC132726383 [Ruditapes philippinarum]|uniref:uncharacterized protein LOC132726383 n=1 Tax=Ruditapes philippinarum TaxID=129788 RepID=UPI00295B4C42|nr:uncharacterized protein LOC132726383 [Ruditapes philippinarum]